MEHGGSFTHSPQTEKSTSDSSSLQQDGGNIARDTQMKEVKPVAAEEQVAVREEHRNLPNACVQRLMRKALPSYAKITEEAKEKMLECVTEFIIFITGEANLHCQMDERRTVTAEDLLYAMRELGFNNYVELLNLYLQRFRDDAAATRHSNHVGHFPTVANEAMPPSTVAGFPVMAPVINSMEMGGIYDDGSSGGGSSTSTSTSTSTSNANAYYDPIVSFVNRSNFLGD